VKKSIGYLSIVLCYGVLATAQAQTPAASTAFDGTYHFASSTQVNTTYTDRNGRMGYCPNRKPGPLHIANGLARYTNATGYKLRGTVGPQGQLVLGLVAPSNANNAGSRFLQLNVNGAVDGSGTARVRQTSNSCSYDFVWQK